MTKVILINLYSFIIEMGVLFLIKIEFNQINENELVYSVQ